jgi:triosephosphate isomerase
LTPLIAANWKMHKTLPEAAAFVQELLPLLAGASGVEVVIAPPFPALDTVRRALAGSAVALAAQNVNANEQGAFTGEVSAAMLADCGCRYAIVGHSERRAPFGEDNAGVARKAAALLARGIRPIVCVGETLAEREAGRSLAVVGAQLRESLAGIAAASARELVIAYEPVWAIGTGKTATPAIAQEVHAALRAGLRALYPAAAAEIRIQYGGSVKPDNAGELLAQPDIDGALVGGASLEAKSLAAIARASGSKR